MNRYFMMMIAGLLSSALSGCATGPGADQASPSGGTASAKLDVEAAARTTCSYESLKKLTATTENLLEKSMDSSCPALMTEVLMGENETDLFAAADQFSSAASAYLTPQLGEMKGKDRDDPEVQPFTSGLRAVGEFWTFLKLKCPKDDVLTDACKAKKTFATNMRSYNEASGKYLAEEQAAAKEAFKHSPEHVFKMKFCKNPNLAAIILFTPGPIEKNCIYSLDAHYFFAIQSGHGGVLAGPQYSQWSTNQTIFIKTRKQYADGDMLQPQFVRSTGLMKYVTVLGAQKTVNSFQFLGDGVSDGN